MIPIKIHCGCGQPYAFDVEPVQGRMPYPVACPACGLDGTAAANGIIAQSMPAIAPPPTPVRVAAVAVTPSVTRAGPRSATILPGQLDRSQAQHEARAKILWGDPPAEVALFLMGHGIPASEASAMVEELFEERAATIRGNGIEKMVIGGMLIFVPIAAWFIFMHLGYILVKTFLVTIVAGLCGVWMVIKGVTMFFSPKSESGDAGAQ
jgi:hypothetical protein